MKDLYVTLSICDIQYKRHLTLLYHYVECPFFFVIMLNVIMLSVVMLNLIMLSVVVPVWHTLPSLIFAGKVGEK